MSPQEPSPSPSKSPSKFNDQALRAVRAIWDKVAQPGTNGKKFIVFANRNDLVYLFCTGFVDERKHTLRDWVDSFQECLQEDGSYAVPEEHWMSKAQYRFSGPVGQPFNPLLLREGDWSEKEMEGLIKGFLLPAVYFTEKEFRSIFDEAKPTFFKNGVYKVTKDVKQDFKTLLDMYPSPAQVRALGLAEARAQMSGKAGSGFTTGPAQSQVAAQRLADLLGSSGGNTGTKK